MRFFIFRKGFQKNVQDSIQMPDITKRNSNVHFSLGNTGHATRGLTVILCLFQINRCNKQHFVVLAVSNRLNPSDHYI